MDQATLGLQDRFATPQEPQRKKAVRFNLDPDGGGGEKDGKAYRRKLREKSASDYADELFALTSRQRGERWAITTRRWQEDVV